MKITIVGGGISGLATAYVLSQKNHEIKIIAKDFSPNLTSNRAAAFWFPYHIRNDSRGIHWCKYSYGVYKDFSQNDATGISMRHLLKVVRNGVEEEEMNWFRFMPEGAYRKLNKDELQKEYRTGYDVQVPLIETQIFLPWLMEYVEQNNAITERKEIESFDEIADADFIINCTGLGARELCKDENIIPVRGQVALLEPIKNFPIFLDNEMPLYIVPRKDATIIGGTYEEGIAEEITVPSTIERLLENACNAFPKLKEQKVLGSWSGIRPYRPLVRLEREGKIIHNYGHGGSGFSVAWGCAEEVASLMEA